MIFATSMNKTMLSEETILMNMYKNSKTLKSVKFCVCVCVCARAKRNVHATSTLKTKH